MRGGHLQALLADLSPTEARVVEQVAYGGSNAEVADVLIVAEQTVKFHLGNVFRKVEVSSRTELLALYWQSALRDAEHDRDEALSELARDRPASAPFVPFSDDATWVCEDGHWRMVNGVGGNGR